MTRAYIDIDGVLIRSSEGGNELIPHFCKVIEYLKKNFDCYWLTTHVRHDSGSRGAINKLRDYLRDKRIDLGILDGIKPTSWQTLKTEAIDFSQPFIWLEDDPLSVEREIIQEMGFANSLVYVDWQERPTWLTVRRLKQVRRALINQSNR